MPTSEGRALGQILRGDGHQGVHVENFVSTLTWFGKVNRSPRDRAKGMMLWLEREAHSEVAFRSTREGLVQLAGWREIFQRTLP